MYMYFHDIFNLDLDLCTNLNNLCYSNHLPTHPFPNEHVDLNHVLTNSNNIEPTGTNPHLQPFSMH